MAAFTTIFDNRELALLIWLFALMALGFISKRLRPSFVATLKALLAPKLITILALMAVYAGLLVYLLSLATIWTADLTGETIFWFFGPGFVLFLNLNKASEDSHLFRRFFMAVFKLTVLIEFLVNVYPLNLVAEFALVPIFVLLGGTLAVAASRAEYRQAKALLDFIVGAVGVFFLGYAVFRIVKDLRSFATLGTVREFLVPLMLAITNSPQS